VEVILKNLELVIGIPAYNEEKSIGSVILKLQKITNKIIVCNDGSTDLTAEIAQRLGAIVINHPKNLGYGAGINSIFLKAKEINADILVTFDADGQHRVEDIHTVIEPIKRNEADIVIGSRFLGKDDDVPEYRKIGIKVITKVTNSTLNEKLTDSQSGFRAYNKKALTELTLSDQGMGISTEILIKASNKGMKIAEVPIKILYKGDTSTHNAMSHGVSVLFSTMKFVSIEHPLKFYGIPGMILSAIGLFFVVWTIQYFAEFRIFPPVLALIAIGATLLGVMLIMTSILLYSLVNVVRERRT
jgi:glycosyltransferase involved in cell wall biosynthesis